MQKVTEKKRNSLLVCYSKEKDFLNVISSINLRKALSPSPFLSPIYPFFFFSLSFLPTVQIGVILYEQFCSLIFFT